MTCRCRTPQEHAQRAVEQAQYSAQATAERLRKQAAEHEVQANRLVQELAERSPNPDDFKIVDYEQVDRHLVLKVQYPSCKRCEFDQCKVMVFLDRTLKSALRWKRIDPHFYEKKGAGEVPSPVARFPASAEGWSDAIAYARNKARP